MTAEQRAAFINAQVAMFYAAKAVMDAENEERARQGYRPAHGPEQFENLRRQYEPVLDYNAVIQFFNS